MTEILAGTGSQSALTLSLINGMPAAVTSSHLSRQSHNRCMLMDCNPSVVFGCCKQALVRSSNRRPGLSTQRPFARVRWWPMPVLQAAAVGSSEYFHRNAATLVNGTEDCIRDIPEAHVQIAEPRASIVSGRLSFDLESRETDENDKGDVIEENISRDADGGSAVDEKLKNSIDAKSLDMILASKAYECAQEQLVQVSKILDRLCISHAYKDEKLDLYFDSQVSFQENAREISKLKLQMASLEQDLKHKNETLQLVMYEAKRADEQLRVFQETTLSKDKAFMGSETTESLESTPLDELLSKYMHHESLELIVQEGLASAETKVSTLNTKVHHMRSHLAGWKLSLNRLEQEGKLSSHALQLAAQELHYAKAFIASLTSRLHQQARELEINMAGSQALTEELEKTRRELEVKVKSLSSAEAEISSQKKLLISLQEALKDEKQASTAALTSTAMQEKALRTAENSILELTSEVVNLKKNTEKREEQLNKMHEEAKRHAEAMVLATKNEEALVNAEKRIKQLAAQISTREEEIRSRDLLLNEIKEDAVQTTEALKFATKIKQDLNLSKEREFELTQELESQTEIVSELRQEIMENERATHAEQALRQAEKEVKELNTELDILRKGVQARDEALKLMKDEIDRNIGVLSYAAENRESLQRMKLRIKELEAELKRRDVLLKFEKEQQLGTKDSNLHAGSSDINITPPAILSSLSGEMPKARKRSQRNTQSSRKNPSQGSTL